MNPINYNGKRFRSRQNTASGDVGPSTIFHYFQDGDLVWATYEGGSVRKGQLIARADQQGILDMRYQHLDTSGELKTGICQSTPDHDEDGRLILRESWQWTCGDCEKGSSIIEEI